MSARRISFQSTPLTGKVVVGVMAAAAAAFILTIAAIKSTLLSGGIW